MPGRGRGVHDVFDRLRGGNKEAWRLARGARRTRADTVLAAIFLSSHTRTLADLAQHAHSVTTVHAAHGHIAEGTFLAVTWARREEKAARRDRHLSFFAISVLSPCRVPSPSPPFARPCI